MRQGATKPTDTDDAAAGQHKSSRAKSLLLPALVIAAALVLAAKLMGGGAAGGAEGSSTATTSTTVEELHPVALDPMTLNLADGRFLKIQLGLGLRADDETSEEAEDADLRARWAKAVDRTIGVLGGMTYADLTTADGRAGAKDLLERELSGLYDGQIAEVYFLEFIMQ